MSNLRAGVQILIDQLASNPDEFFGDLDAHKRLTIGGRSGKFSSWQHIIETELISGARYNEEKSSRSYTWFLSDEEKAALAAAYIEARKLRFDAEIIATMAEKPEETATLVYNTANRYGNSLATSMAATKEAVASSVITGFSAVEVQANGSST